MKVFMNTQKLYYFLLMCIFSNTLYPTFEGDNPDIKVEFSASRAQRTKEEAIRNRALFCFKIAWNEIEDRHNRNIKFPVTEAQQQKISAEYNDFFANIQFLVFDR